jgi:hypothetical protein
MPSTVLLPTSQIAISDWSLTAGVGGLAVDSTANYAMRNDSTFGNYLEIGMTNLPAVASGIETVTGTWRRGFDITPSGGNFMNASVFRESVGSAGSRTKTTIEQTAATGSNSYTSGGLACPGGGTWTVAIVNEAAIYLDADKPSAAGGAVAFAYYTALNVTYRVQSGGFALFCSGLAGAALGLSEMAGLARALYRRAGTLILPDEYREAWRDIRFAPRRAYA